MKAFVLCLALAPSLGLAQEAISLSEAVRKAREASPGVLAAKAGVEAARQEARMARAQFWPQVGLNGFVATSKPGAILTTPAGAMPGALMSVPGGNTQVANLMVMIPIWTGGRLEAQLGGASSMVRGALGELAEMEGEAGYMAEEAYLMALLATESLRSAEARVRAADEMLRTTRARFEAGKDIEASVRRADAELAMAKREAVMAKNERAKALLDLQATFAGDLAKPLETVGALKVLAPQRTLDQYVLSARTRRGSVLMAMAEAERAGFDAKQKEAAFRPQLAAQLMQDSANDHMMRGGTAAVVLSIPLFDGGERRADVGKQRAMLSKAKKLVESAQLQAELEVRKAWLDLQTAASNAESAVASLASAEAAYDVMRTRVEAGKGILLDQLDALQTLQQSRADLAQATYEQRLALARLIRAAGMQPSDEATR